MEIPWECEIDLKGTSKEVDLLKKLLLAMDKTDDNDYEYEYNRMVMPIKIGWDDKGVEHALLGILDDRYGLEVYSRYFPDFNLSLAPKLIAALLPHTQFSYHLEWRCSSGGEPSLIYAGYDGNTLKIWEGETDIDFLWDKLGQTYAKIMYPQEEWEDWYEWIHDWEKENDKLFYENFFDKLKARMDEVLDLLGLDKNIKYESMYDLYIAMLGGLETVVPERNKEYEDSFCENMELEDYMLFKPVREKIMEDEELDRCSLKSFSTETLRKCIEIANEQQCMNCLPLLLDELNAHSQKGKEDIIIKKFEI